jgi:hypothetical protein
MRGSPMSALRPPKNVESDAYLSEPLKASSSNLSLSSLPDLARCCCSCTAARSMAAASSSYKSVARSFSSTAALFSFLAYSKGSLPTGGSIERATRLCSPSDANQAVTPHSRPVSAITGVGAAAAGDADGAASCGARGGAIEGGGLVASSSRTRCRSRAISAAAAVESLMSGGVAGMPAGGAPRSSMVTLALAKSVPCALSARHFDHARTK